MATKYYDPEDYQKHRDRYRKKALRHYHKNRAYYIKKGQIRHQRLQQENRRHLLEYLLKHPCVDCGEIDPLVLTFDHVRGEKKFNISSHLTLKLWNTLLEEIQKCDVRCFNCHMKKHTFRTWME